MTLNATGLVRCLDTWILKMNNDDVYHDLVVDLVANCGLNMFTARKVVDFLKQECHIDYDALKEYYLGEDDEI